MSTRIEYGAKAPLLFKVVRQAIRMLVRILFRVEVRGLANIPAEGGYIVAANHLSYLDFVLLLTMLPAEPRIYLMAARENMFCNPFRRFMTTRIGAIIPVDRQAGRVGKEVIDAVGSVICSGGVFGIFPEGTVPDVETGQLLPLKKGMGHFAEQTGAAILPVAFGGTKDLYIGKRLSMSIGPVIPGVQGGKVAAEAQTERVAIALQSMLHPPAPTPTTGIAGWFARRTFAHDTLTYLFMNRAEIMQAEQSGKAA